MKKKIFLIMAVAILAVSCVAFVACSNGEEYPVSMTLAKEIAMAHTGVETSQIETPTAVIEQRSGQAYYNVEFTIEGVKYTYRVNAKNGDIAKIAINDQPVELTACPQVPASNNHAGFIGTAVAKQAALTAVGLSEGEVQGFIEVELDFDKGQYLYEVEFRANGKEYEVEVVASTGTVFKANENHVTIIEPAGTTYIGTAEAKRIALQAAGVEESQVTEWDGVELEKHKGNHVYEVEFEVAGVEHKFKINANTGAIIQSAIEGQGPNLNQEGFIGTEAAKQIALASAGVEAQNVFGLKAELDREMGEYVYEVEFENAGFEYEYTISATTGEIINIERERAD